MAKFESKRGKSWRENQNLKNLAYIVSPQNAGGPWNAGIWKTFYYNPCRYITDKLIGFKDALGFYAVLANTFILNCIPLHFFKKFFHNIKIQKILQ